MQLLPYAVVKPHAADGPACCSPAALGHYACMNPSCTGRSENNGAGRVAVLQIPRHATAEEYAALPLAHQPIDGIAIKTVYACDECAEDLEPFCEHPPPQPVPCPVCAVTDGPCIKRDGVTHRYVRHAARVDPPLEYCAHAHRPDCGVFDGCQCHQDDPAPTRPTHPAAGGHHPDVSRLLFDESAAQALLAQRGIHWWQVREVASVWTQDTKPAMRAEYAALDDAGHVRFDEHGHEVREEIVIELVAPQG